MWEEKKQVNESDDDGLFEIVKISKKRLEKILPGAKYVEEALFARMQWRIKLN